MKETLKTFIRSVLPRSAYRRLMSTYHLALAYLGAVMYRFPSRELTVIAVTGTKGKSSTIEIIRAMLTEAGLKTASAGTIQFCIGEKCTPNKYKMTMVGRFFLQRFLRQAIDAKCTHAVIEMTSEGTLQHRNKFIDLDALVFTNIAPEHLERHGGMEKYVAAKLSIAEYFARTSHKRPRIIVANADDAYGERFLSIPIDHAVPFSLKDAEPHTSNERGSTFVWRGIPMHTSLAGEFNLHNILSALTLCSELGVDNDTLARTVERIDSIAGRAEFVEAGQPFNVVVDYAHTPDSLKALYEAFANIKGRRICVLSATGGGRDTWKRSAMGEVADTHCDIAFITDEDPYDEDPLAIMHDVARGFSRLTPTIIPDRRGAIRTAITEARAGDAVLITGKGTDPCIMRAHGTREEWSDRKVAEEELRRGARNEVRGASF